MSGDQVPGEGPDAQEGAAPGPMFALDFMESSLLYSLLYERSLFAPTCEQVMDEIERRELYPKHRHAIPAAIRTVDNLTMDMRDFLRAFAGDKQVLDLEERVKKMIQLMRDPKP